MKNYLYYVTGIWAYIEKVRAIVTDLDDRVQKAQKNANAIHQLMKKWDKQPMFTRYDDGRAENHFNQKGTFSLCHFYSFGNLCVKIQTMVLF